LLAFGDVGTDGHILVWFAVRIEERDDGGVYPIRSTVLSTIADFSVPDTAASDGRPDAADEVLRVVAGIDDAMILAKQFCSEYLEMVQNLSFTYVIFPVDS